MFIKICSTHFIKAVIRKIKEYTKEKNIENLLIKAFAKLICCRDYGVFCRIAASIDSLLSSNSDISDSNCMSYLKHVNLNTAIEPMPKMLNVEALLLNKEIYTRSPFYEQIAILSGNTKQHQKTDEGRKKFQTYFRTKLLPFAPMWSSIVKERESNASVESYFRFLKKDILGYKLRQKPGRAIQTIRTYTEGKLLEQQFDLTRKTTRKSDFQKLPKESWKSKTKSKNIFTDIIGKFFI